MKPDGLEEYKYMSYYKDYQRYLIYRHFKAKTDFFNRVKMFKDFKIVNKFNFLTENNENSSSGKVKRENLGYKNYNYILQKKTIE